MVNDDAIIVVENVNRHIAEGVNRCRRPIIAARELAGPIIAMTIVLIAVYVPIAFLRSGLTGALFTEFAFAPAGAVTVSAVIALTLTPMLLCLHPRRRSTRSAPITGQPHRRISSDARHGKAAARYTSGLLSSSLKTIPVTVVFAALVLTSIYWLYSNSKNGAGASRKTRVSSSRTDPGAECDATAEVVVFGEEVYRRLPRNPETAGVFQLDVVGSLDRGLGARSPGTSAEKSAAELQLVVQGQNWPAFPAPGSCAFQQPPLPGIIRSADPVRDPDHGSVRPGSTASPRPFTAEALKSGKFIFLDNDLKIDQPQVTSVVIDRAKTAQLGIKLSDVGARARHRMLGGGYVNYFGLAGRSYKVIPQVEQRYRLNADQVLDYYIKTWRTARRSRCRPWLR